MGMYKILRHSKTVIGGDSKYGFRKVYQTEKEYLARLTDYDYASLNEDQKLCYDLIKENFILDCTYADYILYNEVLGPTTGLQAQLPILLAEYNFSSKEDIEDYLLLLKDVRV